MSFFDTAGKFLSPAYGLSKMAKTKNPADVAMPYLNKIPGATKPLYEPYMQQGQQAGQTLTPMFNQMATNPGQAHNDLWNSYTPSHGFDEMLKRAQNGMQLASNAGGWGPEFQRDMMQQMTEQMMGKDQNSWYERARGMQNTGLEGLGHQYDTGFNASTGYGDILGNNLAQQGGLAFQGQSQKNQQQTDMMRTLVGLIQKIGGAAAGGMGGGAGGAMAGGMSGSMGNGGFNPYFGMRNSYGN